MLTFRIKIWGIAAIDCEFELTYALSKYALCPIIINPACPKDSYLLGFLLNIYNEQTATQGLFFYSPSEDLLYRTGASSSLQGINYYIIDCVESPLSEEMKEIIQTKIQEMVQEGI